MALGIAAYSLFSAHDAMIKGVIMALAAPQILFLRGMVIVALCLFLGRTSLVVLPFWKAMDLREVALCVAAGLVCGAAQFMLVEAARSVPASVLGTVEYGALIWSFVFGYLFWGEMPATTVYLGAFLVVAAGLTLALSEHRNRREIIDAL